MFGTNKPSFNKPMKPGKPMKPTGGPMPMFPGNKPMKPSVNQQSLDAIKRRLQG